MFFLVLSYVLTYFATLCCLFLYDFLFIHPKAVHWFLEKGNFNFQKHPSIGVLKK